MIIYDEFLLYKETVKFVDLISRDEENDEYTRLEDFLENKYGGGYGEMWNENYRNINFNPIKDFPTEYLLSLLETNMNSRKLCYFKTLNIELVKFTWKLWEKYRNISYKDKPKIYPHSSYYEIYYSIKTKLTEIIKMNKGELDDILFNPQNPRYNHSLHCRYYIWWQYAYFVLFDDPEKILIDLVDKLRIDDAQDMLMYGIYQMEPKILYSFMKRFLIKIYEGNSECFEPFESGTGSLWQIRDIFDKMEQAGFKPYTDKEYIDIFNKYNVKMDRLTRKSSELQKLMYF